MSSNAAGDDAQVVHTSDTPIHRATILQMEVDELDAMLASIRTRRMEHVKKLEALAQIKADDAILSVFIKLEKAIVRARRAFDKAKAADMAAEKALHAARLLALECSTR